MRIISDFKDYYDGVQSATKDDMVFERKTKEIDFHELKNFQSLNRQFKPFVYSWRKEDINYRHCFLRPGLFGFCGVLYPFVYFTNGEEKYHWSYESLIDSIKTFIPGGRKSGRKIYEMKGWSKWDSDYNSLIDIAYPSKRMLSINWERKKIEEFLNIEPYEFRDFFIENNLAVFKLFIEGFERSKELKFVANPRLKPMGFVKQMDVYTTFQELSMFVGGVLRSIEKDTVGIDDEYLMRQKGFDEWSFKKLPTKKRK